MSGAKYRVNTRERAALRYLLAQHPESFYRDASRKRNRWL